MCIPTKDRIREIKIKTSMQYHYTLYFSKDDYNEKGQYQVLKND